MSLKKYNDDRPHISAELRRAVEVEAGHACSVKVCGEHTYLELHHINEDRTDNRINNLILLCDKHHKMAHKGIIDSKSLAKYKEKLATALYFLDPRPKFNIIVATVSKDMTGNNEAIEALSSELGKLGYQVETTGFGSYFHLSKYEERGEWNCIYIIQKEGLDKIAIDIKDQIELKTNISVKIISLDEAQKNSKRPTAFTFKDPDIIVAYCTDVT